MKQLNEKLHVQHYTLHVQHFTWGRNSTSLFEHTLHFPRFSTKIGQCTHRFCKRTLLAKEQLDFCQLRS